MLSPSSFNLQIPLSWGWLEETTPVLGGWKCCTRVHGALSVMTAGEKRRTKWYASNWAVGSPSLYPSKPEKATDLVQAASGWMMWFAQGRRSPWSPASTGCGGIMTVPTRKMWQWCAQVSPSALLRCPLVVRVIPPGLQSHSSHQPALSTPPGLELGS